MIAHLVIDDTGQGLAEYSLVLALIAVVCVASVAAFGNVLVAQYDAVSTVFP